MRTPDALISALQHPNPTTRKEAARILADSPVERAEAALSAALADPESGVRVAAAYAISQLKNQLLATTTSLALAVRSDPEPSVRETCCYALSSAPKATLVARTTLIDTINEDQAINVRCAAAYALERSGHSAGMDFLTSALRSNDESTQFWAFTNLGMLDVFGDDWMNDPKYMMMLGSPKGAQALAEEALRARPMREAKQVGSNEFIHTAKANGLKQVCVSVTYAVNSDGRVCRFDFVLIAPVDSNGANAPGMVHHVSDVVFAQGLLGDTLGCDNDSPMHFSDGPRLPADDTYLATVLGFQDLPGSVEVSARERVNTFFTLLEAIRAAGIQPQIVGAGMKPILDWAKAVCEESK